MNVAIVGGGITGLTAGYTLAKQGHRITIFEKEKTLGGLAGGFKKKGWQWHLESAYHHLFTNDDAILSLMKELGLEDKLILKSPVTANYYKGKMYQFDSPIHLLRSPVLSPAAKLRTAALVALLKINPFWQPLESITAAKLIQTIGGNEAWHKLWEPLLTAKFGGYAGGVAASWFWARIKKRTPKLYYIEGGFQTLIAALARAIKKNGGTILTNTNANAMSVHKRFNPALAGLNLKKISKVRVAWGSQYKLFDRVLLTVPTPIAVKLLSSCQLSAVSCQLFSSIPHLHAQTLILETKEPILKVTYWLNITDRSFPFLAVVAHTNMIDKKFYGNRHITYFGNYLPDGHPFLSMTKDQLLKKFLPYIKRLNPSCQLSPSGIGTRAVSCQLFTGLYAQPVHQLRYSQRAPKLETQIPNLYLANLDSIYPWDRGTNYAVELGIRVAKKIGGREGIVLKSTEDLPQ